VLKPQGRCSASTAGDCCEHAIEFLDALNALEFDPWTPVDAAWTPKQSVGSALKTKTMAEQAE
jgi:hypothetical protein